MSSKQLGRERSRARSSSTTTRWTWTLVRERHARSRRIAGGRFPRLRRQSRAAEYGAVAAVIRSVGSASLRTPHTGAMRYDPKQPKIPAAAMTAEDAMLVHRLLAQGERVRMHLVLTPRTLPDVESANVIAEIRGSEQPEEIVLIGGHLDSWDLGTGAIDDGSAAWRCRWRRCA